MWPFSSLSKLEALGCHYAFYFAPAGGKPIFQTNHPHPFYSASIIKIPILLSWVHLERTGAVSRDELCDLDAEPQVKGAGFSWLLRARRIPYQDVLLMMIALSDNLCTNLVIRRVGLERLNQVFSKTLGLTGTQLQRKLFDYEARARGLDNFITGEDCIRFYQLIEELSAEERAWVESMLAVCQDNQFLYRNIPVDAVEFRHKTGSINGVLHDWGYTDQCKIFILTQNVPSDPPVYEVFGELGNVLLTGQPS